MKSLNGFKWFLIGIVLLATFGSCKSSRMGKLKLGEDAKVKEGVIVLKCDPPQKRYTKAVELKVKAGMDSIAKMSNAELELGMSQTVTRLADYTSEGLDRDLILFRICQLVNNRNFSAGRTDSLIERTMRSWDLTAQEKKNLNTLN